MQHAPVREIPDRGIFLEKERFSLQPAPGVGIDTGYGQRLEKEQDGAQIDLDFAGNSTSGSLIADPHVDIPDLVVLVGGPFLVSGGAGSDGGDATDRRRTAASAAATGGGVHVYRGRAAFGSDMRGGLRSDMNIQGHRKPPVMTIVNIQLNQHTTNR